jgi:glutaredoxin 3
MASKRKVEVFSAGCPACEEVVSRVRAIACPSCEVTVLDAHDGATARRAKSLGVLKLPAVVIDGTLADCCMGAGVNDSALKAAGLGRPRP